MQSLTDEEIKKDFERFLRHESMKAYVPQDRVLELVKEVIEPDMDELLDSLGHNANDCQWMFFQGEITFHKEVLR